MAAITDPFFDERQLRHCAILQRGKSSRSFGVTDRMRSTIVVTRAGRSRRSGSGLAGNRLASALLADTQEITATRETMAAPSHTVFVQSRSVDMADSRYGFLARALSDITNHWLCCVSDFTQRKQTGASNVRRVHEARRPSFTSDMPNPLRGDRAGLAVRSVTHAPAPSLDLPTAAGFDLPPVPGYRKRGCRSRPGRPHRGVAGAAAEARPPQETAGLTGPDHAIAMPSRRDAPMRATGCRRAVSTAIEQMQQGFRSDCANFHD
jgi:hypothetical protein